MAHGHLLGETVDGRMAFKTSNILQAKDDNSLGVEVSTYSEEEIIRISQWSEELIPEIELRLDLRSLREARLSQSLERHTKAPPIRKPSPKHPRQL